MALEASETLRTSFLATGRSVIQVLLSVLCRENH
jgi:hypothetical protein